MQIRQITKFKASQEFPTIQCNGDLNTKQSKVISTNSQAYILKYQLQIVSKAWIKFGTLFKMGHYRSQLCIILCLLQCSPHNSNLSIHYQKFELGENLNCLYFIKIKYVCTYVLNTISTERKLVITVNYKYCWH